MEHVGILAHSAEGAALCFRELAIQGGAELGEHQHPDVTLDCIAMSQSMPAWDAGDYPTIRKILARSVDRLAAAGATFFVCPDNTAHMALEQPGPDLKLPGLHIATVLAERAGSDGRQRVGILGTKWTMDGWVYPQALAAQGIEHAVPAHDDREIVDRIIFGQLVNGVFTDAARAKYVRIIERLKADGCDAVALVCTEIPLLISQDDSPLPTLDSTRLLARAALEVAIGHRPLPAWRGGAR
jgi:aspartate racemase